MDWPVGWRRTDKWFLGSGDGAQYAPPFPLHLTSPGFWDESTYADLRLDRLFTVLFTDADGTPIPLRGELVEWTPAGMTLRHAGSGREIEEFRCLLPGGIWASRFRLLSGRPLRAWVWSLQPLEPEGYGAPWRSVVEVQPTHDGLGWTLETRWPRELAPDRTAQEAERVAGGSAMGAPLRLQLALRADRPRVAWLVRTSQRHDPSPLYETSLLPGLRTLDVDGWGESVDGSGWVHLLQAYELEGELTVACSATLSGQHALAPKDVQAASESNWLGILGRWPTLRCSDPFMESAYYARVFGLALNTVDIPELPIHGTPSRFGPFVTEGIGFFRNFITYSAQSHLREASWMRDARLGVGILDNLLRVQRSDGSYPGHNYSCRPERDFYHADFATGVRAMQANHPGSVQDVHQESLRRYADWMDRTRAVRLEGGGCYGDSPEPTGAYAIHDMNETGQEYMNRYLFAAEDADRWGEFRVAGVDATTYRAQLDALLGTREASFGFLYEPNENLYLDRLPDGTVSPARPGTCFYPLMLDPLPLLPQRAVGMVRKWLTNPDRFWTPFGFPAESVSEPTYSSEPLWKGQRLNCPWNGRSWPMANAHLVDAIANVARLADPDLRPLAAEALRKCVRLLFRDGDPARPCCYEHYDPISGTPALYRGYDDYMHGWLIDSILRHGVGLQPGSKSRDPLDPSLEFELD